MGLKNEIKTDLQQLIDVLEIKLIKNNINSFSIDYLQLF